MLEGLRVLVVDDNFDSRELVSVILEGYGVQVTAVASAQEALETIAQSQPDLLICDLQMPDQDGCSFISQLRSLPPEQGGQIPALALSGANDEDKNQALACGFEQFFLKPVDPDRLIEVITPLIQPALSSKGNR
jgi:CheY-like chemotaxis protein